MIPEGATVVAINRFIHHDPAIWGEDVESFNPDRWLQDGQFVVKQDFLPFSIGKGSLHLTASTGEFRGDQCFFSLWKEVVAEVLSDMTREYILKHRNLQV